VSDAAKVSLFCGQGILELLLHVSAVTKKILVDTLADVIGLSAVLAVELATLADQEANDLEASREFQEGLFVGSS